MSKQYIPEAAKAMPSTRMRNPKLSQVRMKAPSFTLTLGSWLEDELVFPEAWYTEGGRSMGDLRITDLFSLPFRFFLDSLRVPNPDPLSLGFLGSETGMSSESVTALSSFGSALGIRERHRPLLVWSGRRASKGGWGCWYASSEDEGLMFALSELLVWASTRHAEAQSLH